MTFNPFYGTGLFQCPLKSSRGIKFQYFPIQVDFKEHLSLTTVNGNQLKQ